MTQDISEDPWCFKSIEHADEIIQKLQNSAMITFVTMSGRIVECVFDPRIKPKEMKFREWIEKSAEAYCNEYPDEGYKSIWDEVLS